MNTPSHVLINLALHRAGGKRTADIPWQALFFSGFIPDVPLAILSIAVSFYYRVLLGNNSPDLMETVFHPLYFTHPIWISAHSMLHSPVALGIYLAVLWRWRARTETAKHWLFWFFVGCFLHTSIDIFTHFDDGPLIFWPLNWQIRFHSPISYWDPAHFGSQFIVFELLLGILLLAYLFLPAVRRKFRG